jgi:hypothetical protein
MGRRPAMLGDVARLVFIRPETAALSRCQHSFVFRCIAIKKATFSFGFIHTRGLLLTSLNTGLKS